MTCRIKKPMGSTNYVAFGANQSNYIGTCHMSFSGLYRLIHGHSVTSEYNAIVDRTQVFSCAEEIESDHVSVQTRLDDTRKKLNEIWNDDSFYNYPESIEEEYRYALAYADYMDALKIILRRIGDNELQLPITLKRNRAKRMNELTALFHNTRVWHVLPNILCYCA
jgi:hypothetical protein